MKLRTPQRTKEARQAAEAPGVGISAELSEVGIQPSAQVPPPPAIVRTASREATFMGISLPVASGGAGVRNYSTQPLYNLQPGGVNGYLPKPEDWTAGLCTVFACALQERFKLPMYALVEEAESDQHQTVVHAFCMLGDKAVDGNGVREIPTAGDFVEDGQSLYYEGEPSTYKVIPVTREILAELHNVEDMDDTASALWFIEHSAQFDDLKR